MPIDTQGSARDEHHRIYEAIWRNMDREDNLISQRITWAILLSGGIFAASALLATGVRETRDIGLDANVLRGVFSLLMLVLAVIAFIFSQRTRAGVSAAVRQLDYLKKQYSKRRTTFERYYWPRPFGDELDHSRGTRAAEIFPLMMMVVWGAAAVVEFAAAVYFFTRAAHGIRVGTLPGWS